MPAPSRGLGVGRHLDVVSDRDRHAERRPQRLAERECVLPAAGGSRHSRPMPASASIVSRRADAHARERPSLGACSRGRFAKHLAMAGDVPGTAVGRRRAHGLHPAAGRPSSRPPPGSWCRRGRCRRARSRRRTLVVSADGGNGAGRSCRCTSSRSGRRVTPGAASRATGAPRRRCPGLRFARLIFAGARRWEAMTAGWVDPRRQMAICVWEDEAALERFRERSPSGARGASRPISIARCGWRRFALTAPTGVSSRWPACARGRPGGPIAMLTFANIPDRGLVYFYRGIHRSTGSTARRPNGLIAAVGGPGAAGPRRHDVHHLGLAARRARLLLPPRPAPGDRAGACASTSG